MPTTAPPTTPTTTPRTTRSIRPTIAAMSAPRHEDPQRVLPGQRSWPLFGVAASRAIEAGALAAHPGGLLMQRAGRAVARLARALAPHATHIWVAAGPGGNGGDGLHAAADLQAAGAQVVVSLLADSARLSADAQVGLQRARLAGVSFVDGAPTGRIDLAIDALLGIGATRAPAGAMADQIDAINRCGAPCLAIDLPSGLNADTGALLGDRVVRASATLALLTLKPGLFSAAGRDSAGAIWLDALGIATDAQPLTAHLIGRETLAESPRSLRHDRHKGSFGDVIVVGGAPGMVGAARLAAHAALGAGAGRTIVSLLDTSAAHEDASRPEWLWQRAAWAPGACDLERSTVVCGCGGGDAVRAALAALLSRSARLVLDADALNAVAADSALRRLLSARAGRGLHSILTPHPLEAARLLDSDTAAIQHDRLTAANALARALGVIVVLKGSGTVIAAPDRAPAINPTGNASLASGGTGDVLAGWIAGAWSAGAAATDQSDADRAWRSALASVWLHGAAAVAAGEIVVRALDLVDQMRAVAAEAAR